MGQYEHTLEQEIMFNRRPIESQRSELEEEEDPELSRIATLFYHINLAQKALNGFRESTYQSKQEDVTQSNNLWAQSEEFGFDDMIRKDVPQMHGSSLANSQQLVDNSTARGSTTSLLKIQQFLGHNLSHEPMREHSLGRQMNPWGSMENQILEEPATLANFEVHIPEDLLTD